jgi:EAL domain-containing protein (putative c-di-GMP-specific phosphodiesterase class I)
LATALEQQQQWLQRGIKIGMAVNISAIDLVDMRLPAYVGELQTRFDLESLDLTLEVTESAVMQDPDSALLALKNLRRMGIKLSIDDFGTGFSSMAQLKKMPVDELKIDKAFVLQLASNHEDQMMTKTLVTLARNLGLSTVAEGVEDEESLQQLRAMGATKAQGYHLSRPKSAEDFETWLLDYERSSEASE